MAHQCQLNKTKTYTRLPMCLTDTPESPFDKISVDTIGPLPKSDNNDTYALSILCNLTKYIILVHIPNKKSATVAKAIVENVYLVYGLCKQLLSDNMTEYANHLLKEIVQLLQIQHIPSTPYHPETMGFVERSHRTLNEYLRSYLNENLNNWNQLLRFVRSATTPHPIPVSV